MECMCVNRCIADCEGLKERYRCWKRGCNDKGNGASLVPACITEVRVGAEIDMFGTQVEGRKVSALWRNSSRQRRVLGHRPGSGLRAKIAN